jgi:hypothetical protein
MNHLLIQNIRKTLIIFILLTLSISTQAAPPPITIYAIDLAYRLSESGNTQYNALLNAIEAEGLVFKTVVRPLSRSQLNFKRDKEACIFPATISAIMTNDKSYKKERFVSSTPIDRVSLRALTPPHKPLINTLKDLNDKKIAVVNGLNPSAFFSNINVTLEYTANEETRIKMLHANRIDAILGFVPDVLLAAEALKMPTPSYNPDLSLVSNEGVAFICHDSDSARNFINSANNIIKNMYLNGKLRKILGPYADIVPPVNL